MEKALYADAALNPDVSGYRLSDLYFILFTLIKRYIGLPMRDTYWGMIFTYSSFALPFAVLMLRNYLDSIPKDIDEQAMIDGCSKAQIVFRIILPLSMPGIASVGIYAFIMAWNEILFASVLTGQSTRTISLGLMEYITAQQANWGGMMAACILVSIPVLISLPFTKTDCRRSNSRRNQRVITVQKLCFCRESRAFALRKIFNDDIAYIKDHPETLPVVARWIFDEWGDLVRKHPETFIEHLQENCHDDQVALTLIALLDGEVVGTASLIEYDMDTRHDLTPGWQVCM